MENALLCNSTNASHSRISLTYKDKPEKNSVIKLVFNRKELKMYYSVKLSLVFLLLFKLCLGWNLPPANFLSEFAKRNDRIQLSISVPFEKPSMNRFFRQLTRSVDTFTSKNTLHCYQLILQRQVRFFYS